VSAVRADKPAAAAPVTAQPTRPAVNAAEIELSWEPNISPTAGRAAVTAKTAPVTADSWDQSVLQISAATAKIAAHDAALAANTKPPANAAASKAASTQPTPATAPKATSTPAQSTSQKQEFELLLDTEPAVVTATSDSATLAAAFHVAPFHVAKGVEIPDLALTLDDSQPVSKHEAVAARTPSASVKPATLASVVKPAAKTAAVQKPTPTATTAMTGAAAPKRSDLKGAPPDLDSTQTIRALTSAELDDDTQEKWFAIQLAVSEQPVNLDAMPHLDIFEAYRLYSIANAGSGKILHSLRLGFFREAVSAEAVSGYLKTFFPSPSVLRVSVAENLRFKDAPAPKAVSAPAKPDAKVVDLNAARDRTTKPMIPTVTMEVPASTLKQAAKTDSSSGSYNRLSATGSFKPNATGSFKPNTTGAHAAHPTAVRSAGTAMKHSEPLPKSMSSGKYKVMPKKSLSEQLRDEAKEVALSESAIRKLPKNHSLLSRLVGKLTK
jgi:hypothetical protein